MATNLATEEVGESREKEFPPSNWGPWPAVLGVFMALGVGIVLGIPALIFGQEEGAIEAFAPPSYSQGSVVADTEASALAVDPDDGTIYADEETSVAVIPVAGGSATSFGEFEASFGVAVDGERQRVYVSDRDAGTVSAFRLARRAPEFAFRFATSGLPSGQAADFEPDRLAVDGSAGPSGGSVYALDRGSDVVDRFSPAGRYLGQLDAADAPAGSFDFGGRATANDLAVDGSDGLNAGNVYVVSEEQGDDGTVWAFDGSGSFLWQLDEFDGESVCGVAVDQLGNLWISRVNGGAVQYALGDRPRQAPAPTGAEAATGDRGCQLEFAPGGSMVVAQEFEGDLTTGGSVFLQLATALAFLLVPMAIASWRGAAGLREVLRRLGVRRFRPSAFKWVAATVGAYLLFAMLYALLIVEPEQEDIASGFGPIWVQILLIVVAASISEEICFRGFLFGGLRERLPKYTAALLTGTIFGVLHAMTGITAVPPLIFFGFVMCLLYEKTGSVVPGILLHMLNNSVALLAQ